MEGPDEADEYCPHCDNHFLSEAVTQQGVLRLGKAEDDLREKGKYIPIIKCQF